MKNQYFKILKVIAIEILQSFLSFRITKYVFQVFSDSLRKRDSKIPNRLYSFTHPLIGSLSHKLSSVLCLLLTVLCLLFSVSSYAAISTIDTKGGAYSSLQIRSDSMPAVAYHDSKSGELRYAYWDGSQWVRSVIDDSGVAGEFVSLKLVGNNPRISYYHFTEVNSDAPDDLAPTKAPDFMDLRKGKHGKHMVGTLKYAYCDAAPCVNKSDWTIVDIAQMTAPGGIFDMTNRDKLLKGDYLGGHSSLAFDSGGTKPRIAYIDYSYVDTANLNAWQDPSNPPNAWEVKKGAVKIAYCDTGCGTSSNWSTKVVDKHGARSVSLAINSTNKAMVSYFAADTAATTDQGRIRYAESTDLATWTTLTIASDAATNSKYTGMWWGATIALNGSGDPRIAYQRQTQSGSTLTGYGSYSGHTDAYDKYEYLVQTHLYFKKCGTGCTTGSNWSTERRVDISGGGNYIAGSAPSLVVNSSNLPRIASHYVGKFTSSVSNYVSITIAKTSDLRLSTCTNADCSLSSTDSTDTTGETGKFPSIALDTAQNSWISYYNSTDNKLLLYHPGSDGDFTGSYSINANATDAIVGGGVGIQAGDTVSIVFPGTVDLSSCSGGSINVGNINTVLALSNGHSWLDGAGGIGTISWTTTYNTNDTLVIKLTTNSGNPTIATGDKIFLDGTCLKIGGVLVKGTIKIAGSFDSDLPSGVVSYWPMDEGQNFTAHDTIGNHDAGLFNDAAWTGGVSGYGLYFDGSNDYLDTAGDPADFDMEGAGLTIEAWIKPVTSVTTDDMVISKASSYEMVANGQCRINTSGSGGWTWVGSGKITAGETMWHHVVCTYDSKIGEQRVYIDGEFDARASGVTGNVKPSNFGLSIGRRDIENRYYKKYTVATAPHHWGGGYGTEGYNIMGKDYYKGYIDEVVVYNRPITATEVKDRYNSYSPQWITATASDASGQGTGIQGGDTVIIQFATETDGATIDSTNIDSAILVFPATATPTLPALPSGAISHWKFDEGAGTNADDSLRDDADPDENDGTISGAAYVNSPFSKALSFNSGSSNYVSIENESKFDFIRTGAFTIEAWIKTNTSGSGISEIVSKMANSSPFKGYEFFMLNNTGKLRGLLVNSCQTFTNSNGYGVCDNIAYAEGSTLVNDNKWHHVAMVYDGTTFVSASNIKFYVDGSPDVSTILTDSDSSVLYNTLSDIIKNNIPLNIGSRNNQTSYFNGFIDEVVVYNRALSASEVFTRYSSMVTAAASGVRTWKDGSGNIDPATWSNKVFTNDTLTIALKDISSGKPNIAVGDTVLLNGVIKDKSGNPIIKSAVIGGSFDSAGTISYWKFDGDATDSVGSNDGTLAGTANPSFVSGRFNNALSFDGVDNYVNIARFSGLPTAQFSLEA